MEATLNLLYTVYTDGATRRSNPGPSSWAFVMTGPGGDKITHGGFILEATNNAAEYSALIQALQCARARGIARLKVFSDSKLMVEQMKAHWVVNQPTLLKLWAEATLIAGELEEFSIYHIPRELNTEADAECNRVLDIHIGSRN